MMGREGYAMTVEELDKLLTGTTVVSVERPDSADEGLEITFHHGVKVYVGYSGCEGSTQVKLPDTPDHKTNGERVDMP